VWAAGVTYEHSRTARMAESENFADIYDRVYDTARPELFFKSAAWRVWDPGVPVSVRLGHRRPRGRASRLLNYAGDVVGYTVCDDELAVHRGREPESAVLSTGTSLVPDLPFTLRRVMRSGSRSGG
jgi:hypothetical protein